MRVLVTGASSGVGAAIGRALDRAGAETLLTARRADELAALVADGLTRAAACPADQIDPAARRRLIESVDARWAGSLDGLVCCAGVGAVGPFAEASPDRLRQVFEVNTLSTIDLIRECLPLLTRGRAPIVVVIGSVLGHRAVPGKAEYCASKFALHGFCDAVRAEWAGRIDVTLISPGTIASPFWQSLIQDKPAEGAGAGRADPGGDRWGAITPDRVAAATVAAMRAGRHEVVLPWQAKALVWLDRLLPTVADRAVARAGRSGG